MSSSTRLVKVLERFPVYEAADFCLFISVIRRIIAVENLGKANCIERGSSKALSRNNNLNAN